MATVRLQLRRGTASQWTSSNPILAAGEMGVETDTRKVKIGDGTSTWTTLDYVAADVPAIGEIAQDAINDAFVAGTGITKSYDDAGNTITVSVDTSVIATKAELAEVSQDSVNDAIVAGVGLDKVYDDNANTITLDIDSTVATKTYADQAEADAISAAASDATTKVAAEAALRVSGDAASVSTAASDATTKANAAQAAAEATSASALSSHENDTTNIHGIADTSILVTTTGAQTLTAKTLTSPNLTGTPTSTTATVGTDTTQIATTAFVQDAIEAVVGAAPEALNTLAEIATSLANDANLSGTLTTSISGKVAKSGDTMSGILNMGDNKITGLATAVSLTDATSKQYVDYLYDNSVAAAAGALSNHEADTTNIHGIGNTQNLVLTDDERLSNTRTPSDDSVTSAKIVDSSVTSAKVADNAVTTDKIADLNVTTPKVADSAVTTAKIADLNVTSAKVADSAVTTAKIADSNVTTDKINNNAVTTDKIDALAVTEGKIADGSITSAKIANGTIVDGDINATAAISQSKVADLPADLALKAPLDSPTFTGTVSGVTATMVGLANVDNTSDANKPVSTATQTALDLKANLDSPTFTGTVSGVTKTHVGLGSADNTSDADKPVSTAQATAIATAKSEAIADATSQVNAVIASAPAALDTLDELAAALGDDANFATTVTNSLAAKAPLADPTFTGTVTVSASGIAFSDGTQTKLGVPSVTTFATAISSSATLAAGEEDKFVPLTGAVTITLPASGYSTGQSIDFYQDSGTGAQFNSTNGVVGTPGLKFRTTNSVVTAMKTSSGWLVFGDLSA